MVPDEASTDHQRSWQSSSWEHECHLIVAGTFHQKAKKLRFWGVEEKAGGSVGFILWGPPTWISIL